MTSTGEIIRSVWTYTVNGVRMGTYDEDYSRGMYDTLTWSDKHRVALVRIDHVASDFATTGRHWDEVPTIVAGYGKDEAEATDGQLVAAAVDRITGEPSTYTADATGLLLDLFRAARERGCLVAVNRGFHQLADEDGYRVHKLLLSLKGGRQVDVMRALVGYWG